MLIFRFNFFWRIYCTVVHNGYSVLHSYQQGANVPVSPHIYNICVCVSVSIHPNHLKGCQVAFDWFCLRLFFFNSGFEYLFMYLFTICIFSSREIASSPLFCFQIILFTCFLLLLNHWSSLKYLIVVLHVFYPFVWVTVSLC